MTDYQLRGYVVAPRGVNNIREQAVRVRALLGLPDSAVDLEVFLESLVRYGVTLDVVEESEMPGFPMNSEAYCVPENATIYLSTATYEKACRNDPRTRFTIFHEVGHLVLFHRRELHRGKDLQHIKPYMDSEWQADQFAAETAMPIEVILRGNLDTPEKIRQKFGVSEPAAERRYEQLKKRGDIK